MRYDWMVKSCCGWERFGRFTPKNKTKQKEVKSFALHHTVCSINESFGRFVPYIYMLCATIWDSANLNRQC